MFGLVYAGFDTLDIAFQGALEPKAVEHLKAAREQAEERDEKTLVTIGPGKLEAHLSPHGRRGGYAFVLDTGPEGEQWLFKASSDPNQWNGFVSVASGALVTLGLEGVERRLYERLEAMGFLVTDHAVNRIDYAMDFVTDRFEPRVEQFVAHSNCKAAPHWSPKDIDDTLPSPVYRGRRIETVTIGKMPGRQVIVYDKRRDSITKQKYWWFEVWSLNRYDDSFEIWRVEVRAGKKELKDKWNLRCLTDIKEAIGDVYARALEDVRYLSDDQSDGNVTRQTLHPLWIAAQSALENSPDTKRAGLFPGQVKEVERQKAIDTARSLIIGNACGLAAAYGWDTIVARESLPDNVLEMMRDLVERSPEFFEKKIERALEAKYFFQGS